jgi:hypothetical protein
MEEQTVLGEVLWNPRSLLYADRTPIPGDIRLSDPEPLSSHDGFLRSTKLMRSPILGESMSLDNMEDLGAEYTERLAQDATQDDKGPTGAPQCEELTLVEILRVPRKGQSDADEVASLRELGGVQGSVQAGEPGATGKKGGALLADFHNSCETLTTTSSSTTGSDLSSASLVKSISGKAVFGRILGECKTLKDDWWSVYDSPLRSPPGRQTGYRYGQDTYLLATRPPTAGRMPWRSIESRYRDGKINLSVVQASRDDIQLLVRSS